VEEQRDLIDRRHVTALDDRTELDVAEERDLALHILGEGTLAAADEDVRLDPDLHQLANGVLRRLGLDLAGRGDVGHEGEVNEDRVVAADLLAELPDGLEERERLDVADGAADLDDHHIVVGGDPLHRRLDLVRDVRNDLHGGAEELAAALLRDDVQINPAGGDVVELGERAIDEPLVVAEVEIGLRAVVGDEDLAVLERRHRSRVDVEIRVELEHRDAQTAFGEQATERRRRDPLSEG
jgi:hypothetical protein